MNRGSAEAIRAALRRSLPLIVALVVLGAVAMNLFTQLRGPQYQANARVLLTTSEVTALLTGTQPAFLDPDQVQDTAVALADSPVLYERVATRTGGRLGTADELDRGNVGQRGRGQRCRLLHYHERGGALARRS